MSHALPIIPSKRPRNVNAIQAAAILYGDWGTSKAYVIGLAFAIAGYSSFWLILMVSILNVLVGMNYLIVCKCYPSGGGVYASVRHRSEILALIGGFFLIADYLVTATLSVLSAFQYLGVTYPEKWAYGALVLVGGLNFFGPRHTGNLAFLIAIPTVIVVSLLGVLSFFYLEPAIQAVQPLQGGFWENWKAFASIIVALSGIEAIANTTGVMKLDPGSTEKKPSVVRTSTPAILTVMFEVCFFTTLFGLAMHALPGLMIHGSEVDAPNYPNVRDSMLRYMGQTFGSSMMGPHIGQIFGYIISIAFCALLLSAVNTAMVALISLMYIMSRDGELPSIFQKLNSYGVPKVPLLIATAVPLILLYSVNSVAGLANLYAVGFVGAIATNLGSTSTDWKLDLGRRERVVMFGTFLIMAAIEITLFVDKPDARNFVIAILASGLLLRGLVLEQRVKVKKPVPAEVPSYFVSSVEETDVTHVHSGAMLCAVNHVGKTLEFALQECKEHNQQLYVLFVRGQPVITETDLTRHWLDDKQACEIFDYIKDHVKEGTLRFLYVVSDAPSHTIVEMTHQLQVSRLILGMPRSNPLFQMIHGNVVQDISKVLSKDIDLVVIC